MSTATNAFAALGAASLLLAGCDLAKKTAGTLGELQVVQREVARSLGHPDVRVNLSNGRLLSISVVNSPFGTLPEEERAARALEVARVAFRGLRSRASLERVTVLFVEKKTYVVASVSTSTGAYAFVPADLEGGSDGAAKP
jgi:hypothetical protein